MVALDPGDLSTNLLSVQLGLERYGDAAGWRRATITALGVIELIGRDRPNEKSPRVSNEQFEKDKQRGMPRQSSSTRAIAPAAE